MRRRSLTRIVAAVDPVALVVAVSQAPSASAATAAVTSVTSPRPSIPSSGVPRIGARPCAAPS